MLLNPIPTPPEEIDAILMRANKTYRREKGGGVAERKARAVARILEDEYHRYITEDEIAQMAHSFETDIRGEQPWTENE